MSDVIVTVSPDPLYTFELAARWHREMLVADWSPENCGVVDKMPHLGEVLVTQIRVGSTIVWHSSRGYSTGSVQGLLHARGLDVPWTLFSPLYSSDSTYNDVAKRINRALAESAPTTVVQEPQKETQVMDTKNNTKEALTAPGAEAPGLFAELAEDAMEGATLGLVLGGAREAQVEAIHLLKKLGASDDLLNHPFVKALIKGGVPTMLSLAAPHIPGMKHRAVQEGLRLARKMATAEIVADGFSGMMQIARPMMRLAISGGFAPKEIADGEAASDGSGEVPDIQVTQVEK